MFNDPWPSWYWLTPNGQRRGSCLLVTCRRGWTLVLCSTMWFSFPPCLFFCGALMTQLEREVCARVVTDMIGECFSSAIASCSPDERGSQSSIGSAIGSTRHQGPPRTRPTPYLCMSRSVSILSQSPGLTSTTRRGGYFLVHLAPCFVKCCVSLRGRSVVLPT